MISTASHIAPLYQKVADLLAGAGYDVRFQHDYRPHLSLGITCPALITNAPDMLVEETCQQVAVENDLRADSITPLCSEHMVAGWYAYLPIRNGEA